MFFKSGNDRNASDTGDSKNYNTASDKLHGLGIGKSAGWRKHIRKIVYSIRHGFGAEDHPKKHHNEECINMSDQCREFPGEAGIFFKKLYCKVQQSPYDEIPGGAMPDAR